MLGLSCPKKVERAKEVVHFGLDVVGILPVPVVSVPADLINTAFYALELDFKNAGFSAVALVPYAGDSWAAGRMPVKRGGRFSFGVKAADDGLDPASDAWRLGKHHSPKQWENRMKDRGWTSDQIDEAIANGAVYPAPNRVNPDNSATRYVHPETGRSVIIDDVTKEVLLVGGDNFRYD